MDVDDLTIRQARELAGMFGSHEGGSAGEIFSKYIGKYVIIRSRNEGINAGVVEAANHNGVVLKSARRILWHKPKDPSQSWYEGVANSGLSNDSKVSAAVESKVIVEDYSITQCTDAARRSIEGIVAHAG